LFAVFNPKSHYKSCEAEYGTADAGNYPGKGPIGNNYHRDQPPGQCQYNGDKPN
jgi:hypothetical protein